MPDNRVHGIIRRTFGSAKEYICVDCGKQAQEWSWEHDTDPENINNYWPRCKSCHRNYDMTDECRANISAGRAGLNIGHVNTQGSKHGMSKLVEDDVLEIRASSLSRYELANQYGVSHKTIDNIIRRETWRHV